MIHTLRCGSTSIGWTEIPSADSRSRRAAEQAAVRRIVDSLLGPDIVISHTPDGAPTVPDAYISITHSRRIAAVAINREHPIGIDAEEWRPTLRRVASRFLCEEELPRFTSDLDLLRAWTIKEAVYKIAGLPGISLTDIHILSTDLARVNNTHHTIHHIPLSATLLTLVFPA